MYTTRLATHATESAFMVEAETPAKFPAVIAAAYNGNASKPFAEHASARIRRLRSWSLVSVRFGAFCYVWYLFVHVCLLQFVHEASRVIAIEELRTRT